MNITQFLPENVENISLEEKCSEEFLQQQPMNPFNAKILDFLAETSQSMFQIPDIKNYPELSALAFWLRKANIQNIIEEFLQSLGDNELVMPRGVVFHIAPSNVDTIFLYSWIFSMLSGNLNIVRISQTHNDQLDALLMVLQKIMTQPRWRQIAKRNLIISYPHDTDINQFISRRADVRMIWGGDKTVQSIRSLPAKPSTKDITFNDKVSYSAVHSERYTYLDGEKVDEMAHLFYNDAYQFQQMACSSPRLVYFVGSPEQCIKASKRFWEKLATELQRRRYHDDMSMAIDKLFFAYQLAGRGTEMSMTSCNRTILPTVVRIPINEVLSCRNTCGGGFFFECFIESLEELASVVQANDQTLSYIGFSCNELKESAGTLCMKGINRIVPVGQALTFSPNWDGYVLLTELTKRVSVL